MVNKHEIALNKDDNDLNFDEIILTEIIMSKEFPLLQKTNF